MSSTSVIILLINKMDGCFCYGNHSYDNKPNFIPLRPTTIPNQYSKTVVIVSVVVYEAIK